MWGGSWGRDPRGSEDREEEEEPTKTVTGAGRLAVLRAPELTWGGFPTPRTSCCPVPCGSTLQPPAGTSLGPSKHRRLLAPRALVVLSQPPLLGPSGCTNKCPPAPLVQLAPKRKDVVGRMQTGGRRTPAGSRPAMSSGRAFWTPQGPAAHRAGSPRQPGLQQALVCTASRPARPRFAREDTEAQRC